MGLSVIQSLDPTESLIVFVSSIVLLLIFEVMIEKIWGWAERNKFGKIFDKLQKQLLELGVISFAIFVFDAFLTSSTEESTHKYFLAFEFTHVVLLFIGFAFIIQAFTLIQYALNAGDVFLAALRVDCDELLENFNKMDEDKGSLESYLFHNCPIYSPWVPTMRVQIEYKIIEKLYTSLHNFPLEVSFAKYLSELFQTYICELGDVSPHSWALLIVFAILNFFRINLIDPSLVDVACGWASDGLSRTKEYDPYVNETHTDDHSSSSGHRYLSSTATESVEFACADYYILSYSCICQAILAVFITGVYIAACHYVETLVDKSLEADELDYKKMGKYSYKVCLENMSKLAHEKSQKLANLEKCLQNPDLIEPPRSLSKKSSDLIHNHNHNHHHENGHDNGHSHRPSDVSGISGITTNTPPHTRKQSFKDMFAGVFHSPSKEHDHDNNGSRTNSISGKHAVLNANNELDYFEADNAESKKHFKSIQEKVLHHRRKKEIEQHEEALRNAHMTFFERMHHCWHHVMHHIVGDEEEHWHDDFDKVFLFNSPRIFFKCVEFSIFFQCFYIAIWSTQLIPMCLKAEKQAEWIVLISFPIVYCFFLVRNLLSKTILLRAVRHLDEEVLGKVYEEASLEYLAIKNLRKHIRKKLREHKILKKGWKGYIQMKFNEADVDGSQQLSKTEFRRFLGDLEIYMPEPNFQALWSSVDYDLSGFVSWDELFVLVFPEMKATLKAELSVAKKLREAIDLSRGKDSKGAMGPTAWKSSLKSLFQQFDDDDSGYLDKAEFKQLVTHLNLDITDKSVNILFGAVTLNEAGKMSYSEFSALVDPLEGLEKMENGDDFNAEEAGLDGELGDDDEDDDDSATLSSMNSESLGITRVVAAVVPIAPMAVAVPVKKSNNNSDTATTTSNGSKKKGSSSSVASGGKNGKLKRIENEDDEEDDYLWDVYA